MGRLETNPSSYTPPNQPQPEINADPNPNPNPQPQKYPPPQTHPIPNDSNPQQPYQYPPPQQTYGTQPRSPIHVHAHEQMYKNGPNNNQPSAYPPPSPHKSPVNAPVQFPPPPQNYQTAPTAGVQLQAPPPQPAYVVAAPGIPLPANNNSWTSGLFDCMNDPMNALITLLFPCLTFGQVAEIVDEGHTSCGTSGMLYGGILFCIGMPFIMSCTYRTKLRSKFGLPEAPAPDWITHFLCEYCAICQEYRELQARGWDPSIGWHGNLARNQNMQHQVAMMPPTNQRMMP